MSELELVEEPDDVSEGALPDIEYVRPLGLPEEPPRPTFVRVYDEHEVPEGYAEIATRGVREGVFNPILVIYALLSSVPLLVQRVPWVDQPLALPGQAMCTYVLCFCLLERARAGKEAEREMDVIDIASILWRTLLFLFPLAVGAGTLPLSAYAVVPLLLLGLPLFLGTLATDVWSEFYPPALWAAFRETPNYLATTVLSGAGLLTGMGAVWGFPDHSAFLRGTCAVVAFSFAGAVIGTARRDAELVGKVD